MTRPALGQAPGRPGSQSTATGRQRAGAAPWREVVHIEHRAGERGGRHWSLTLACGHRRGVRIPVLRLRDLLGGRLRLSAPERVRCPLCAPPPS